MSKHKKEKSSVNEPIVEYITKRPLSEFKKEIYTALGVQDLIIYGIFSITRKKEICTFERLVAECFLLFPMVFGFKRYPNWPDSLKFDRSIRSLRQKGLIRGGIGGNYSPGEIALTEYGTKKIKELKENLYNDNFVISKKHRSKPRSIDDKLINYLKGNSLFKDYQEKSGSFNISEPELRNLLRCTLESPLRVVKQNLEYFKKLAESYNEKEIVEFLLFCEKKLIKK